MRKLFVALLGVFLLAGCWLQTPPPTTSTTTTSSSTSTTAIPTSTSTTSTSTTAPTQPTGRFYIVGRNIVGPDGKLFYPIGANVALRVAGYENGYVFNWNGTATGRSQDVLNWGWNTVRPNNICNPPANPGLAATEAGIDAFIDEYTAKKIVVMIDCHDVTGTNPTFQSPSMAPLVSQLERLASKYKNNTYVWFNIPNEPYSNNDTTAWVTFHNNLYNRLRSIAPYNVFVADIDGYGQNVNALINGSALALGTNKCNVLYSWHAYGAISDYNSNFDETKSRAAHKAALEYLKANNIPVVIGEFGDPLTLNEGTAGPPIWSRIGAYAVMDYAPQNGIGLLWWHATGDSGNFLTYSLMADRHQAPWSAASAGAGLSAAGQKFWNISHNKPNLGTFTGSIVDSHCPVSV